MMMSLNEPQRQALGSIEDGLAGSDPRLAFMLNTFSRLAAGEEMPVREKIRVQRGRPTAHRRRRARRHPRRGIALPQARRRYPRLGWQQAMLLLWVVISAALVAVALADPYPPAEGPARALWHEALPPDPRDPDVVRAKALARAGDRASGRTARQSRSPRPAETAN
jgi:hypothetical protein